MRFGRGKNRRSVELDFVWHCVDEGLFGGAAFFGGQGGKGWQNAKFQV